MNLKGVEEMLKIGCHLSASKGYLNMGKEALSINANTFQFFTRNPRGSKAKELDLKDIEEYKKLAEEKNFATILAHAPYILNPCSSNEQNRILAFELMQDDLKRLEHIPNQMYNFHPGSHTGQGIEVGIEQISQMLNKLLTAEQTTTVLLETMAGKGSEVGSKFEELRAIIDRVELKEKMGVCLDTCHVNDAGYDVVNNLDGVLEEFDKIIGIEKLMSPIVIGIAFKVIIKLKLVIKEISPTTIKTDWLIIKLITKIEAQEFLFDESGCLTGITRLDHSIEFKDEFIINLMKKKGLQPEEVVFFGNGKNDETVYRSGVRTICINPDDAHYNDRRLWSDVILSTDDLFDIMPYLSLKKL